jgi:hypothetical protein
MQILMQLFDTFLTYLTNLFKAIHESATVCSVVVFEVHKCIVVFNTVKSRLTDGFFYDKNSPF